MRVRVSPLILSLLAAGPARAQPAPAPARPTVAILSADASVVAAQTGNTVHVWRRASGKRLARLANQGAFRGSVAPGALVAVSDDGITVWRGDRYERKVRLEIPRVLSMGRTSISADGRVATALFARDGGVGDPDTVGVWSAVSGKQLRRITIRGRVLGAALSPDGRLLAIFGDRYGGKGGALLRVHVVATGRRVLRWHSKRDRTTFCAAFSPDRRLLALCAGQRLLLWKLPRRRVAARADVNAIKALFPKPLRGPGVTIPGAHGVAFGPGSKELVTLHGFGVVGVARWSVGPLRPIRWLKRPMVGGTMRQVAWDPEGALWLVTSSYAPRVHLHTPRGDRFAQVRVLE